MSSAININLDIKGLIFDLDGVIADTAHLHYKAWCQIACQWKFDLSVDQNEKLKGVSRKNAMQKIAKWSGKSFSEKELEDFAYNSEHNNTKQPTLIHMSCLCPSGQMILKSTKEKQICSRKMAKWS